MEITFENCSNYCGWLEKKASKIFVGWQKRYFRVVSGMILLYSDKEDGKDPKVIKLSDISKVEPSEKKVFNLTINSREVSLRTTEQQTRDEWVSVLQYLLTNLPKSKKQSTDKDKEDKRSSTSLEHIDKSTMDLVRNAGFGQTEDLKLNEKLLKSKGIDKLINLTKNEIKVRMYSGFLYKKHKSIDIFQKRWFFLFSSRPLKNDLYEKDELTLDEGKYSKEWIKFDQLFYFKFEKDNEASGPIHGLELSLSHEITCVDRDGKYYLLFDVAERKFEFYSDIKAERDLWFEALKNSRRTANEIKASITKYPRNVQRLDNILQSGQDKLKAEMEKEKLKIVGNYREITDYETLKFILKSYRRTISSTIDGCISNNPPKKDLLFIYAEYNLNVYLTIVQSYWSSQYDSIDSENILLLAASLFKFEEKLKRLRVTEPNLSKNAKELVKIYMKKTYKNITDVIENILKSEREVKAIKSEKGELITNGPPDLFDILSKSYGLIKDSKIKYVHIKMLNMFHECIIQYLIGVDCVTSNFNIIVERDFLIAIANNSVLTNTLLQSLIDSCKDSEVIDDKEINHEIRSKEILSALNLMSNHSVSRFVSDLSQKLAESFDCNFMQLNLEKILIVTSQTYGELNFLMNSMIRRKCWEEVLKLTLFYYIKLLLTTAYKKVKNIEDLSNKLQSDKDLLTETYSNYVGENLTKTNLIIIDDILNFLQVSSCMISSSCHTMREYVGPSFNMNMVKALIKLRCDLNQEEQKEAYNICKEVLEHYVDKNKGKTHGFFDKMQQEIKIDDDDEKNYALIHEEETNEVEKKKQNKTKVIDLDHFLLNEENEEEEEEDKKDNQEEEETKEEEQKEEEQISDIVYEGIMHKKSYNTWQTRFFQLKNGYLYWFKDKTSSIVQNKLSIEKTLKVESHKENKFLILVEDKDDKEIGGKVYKFSCVNEEEKEKWINAITSEMKRLRGEIEKKETSLLTMKQKKKVIEDYYKLPDVGKERNVIKNRIINSIQKETFFKFKQTDYVKKGKKEEKRQSLSDEKTDDEHQEVNIMQEGTMQQFEIGFDEANEVNNSDKGVFSCCGGFWTKIKEGLFGKTSTEQHEQLNPPNES